MGHKPFAHLLRAELHRNGLSIRQLGKLTDPDDPERGRRRVQRHLSGVEPSAASRVVYAQVLDAPGLRADDEEDATDRALARLVRGARRELRRA